MNIQGDRGGYRGAGPWGRTNLSGLEPLIPIMICLTLTPTYQVPRSICLPISSSAEEEGEKERQSVNGRPIVTKNVEEEEGVDVEVEGVGEEEGTHWESFSPCQETLVAGGTTSLDYPHTLSTSVVKSFREKKIAHLNF